MLNAQISNNEFDAYLKNRLSNGLSQVFLVLAQMSVNLFNHLGVGGAHQLGNRVHIDAVFDAVRDLGMSVGVRGDRIRKA